MGDCCSKAEGEPAFPLETHPEHDKSITCMCTSDDSSLLITGSDDCTARMWSTRTRRIECIGILKGHSQYITCVTMCEIYVMTGSADNTIRKWDMTTCECLEVYMGHTSRIFRLICTGSIILSTSYDMTAKAWIFDTSDVDIEESDAAQNDYLCLRTFRGHTRAVLPIIFIPGIDLPGDEPASGINPGDVVVTGSADGTARTWSFETAGVLKVMKGHQGPISCMSTDPMGKVLFTGSMDRSIRSWDINSGRGLKIFNGHENGVVAIQVVKNLLYSAGTDGVAKCWVTEFGDCTRTYSGHKHTVSCLKFANGCLFTGSGDTIARAYDAKSGALKREFRGHEAGINCLQYIDGFLYTGSNDGSIMKWDARGLSEEVEDLHQLNQSFNNRQAKRFQELNDQLDTYVDKDY